MTEPVFTIEGRDIFKAPVRTQGENGQSITMGFKVCTVEPFVDNPQSVCELLNIGAKAAGERQDETAHDVLTCLEWAIDQLDKLGELNAYTLGMVQSIEHCRRIIAREKGGAA